MALFNQIKLHNILDVRNDLEAPELRAAVASMTEEQNDDSLIFLECITKELAGILDGWGMQAVVKVCTLGTTFLQISKSKLWKNSSCKLVTYQK